MLTNVRHLRHCGMVGPKGKHRWIVIDVLHFDDELRLRFQRLVRPSVNSLGMKYIVSLLLSVQAFG